MGDLKEIVDGVATKAAIAAGKDAAKRAAKELLSSDEDIAAKEPERDEQRKGRRTKLLVYGVLGLFLVVGVIGLLLSYWQWFLLAGLAGLGGLYGWWRLRKRLAARKEAADEASRAAQAAEAEATRRAALEETERARVASAKQLAEARAEEARAALEARAADEQAVEDELAAMKARLKK